MPAGPGHATIPVGDLQGSPQPPPAGQPRPLPQGSVPTPPVVPPTSPPDNSADEEQQLLATEQGPDLSAYQFFSLDSYSGQAFVTRVQHYASVYDIDALAAAANAYNEGIDGGIGDGGTAFGPWQIHAEDGRLRSFFGLPRSDPRVNTWAWGDDGVDYAFRSMVAGGARGLTGAAAVHAIVFGFERPAHMQSAYQQRLSDYDSFVANPQQAWQLIASRARGPQSVAPTKAAPTVASASTTTLSQAFGSFIDGVAHTAPEAGDHAATLAALLPEVFL